MEQIKAHPYTQAVLDAWRRLSLGQLADGPTTDDFPGLVGNLFVLNAVDASDFSFRRVGVGIERLFGRQLFEHNFLSLWSEADRALLSAALTSAHLAGGPALVRARGETLDGRCVDLEFALAPLPAANGGMGRILGLCQAISTEAALGGRPLRRLQAIAVYPPARPERQAAIRLVSSN